MVDWSKRVVRSKGFAQDRIAGTEKAVQEALANQRGWRFEERSGLHSFNSRN